MYPKVYENLYTSTFYTSAVGSRWEPLYAAIDNAVAFTDVVDSTYKNIKLEKTFQVSSSSALNVFLATQADLNIIGWDRNEIQVNIQMEGRNIQVDCRQEAGNVYISSSYQAVTQLLPVRGLIQLKVPRKLAVRATILEGEVIVADMQGDTWIEGQKGNMKATSLAGKATLATHEGFLQVTGGNFEGNLSALHGSLALTNVKGKVNASSLGGIFSVDSPNQPVEATMTGQAMTLVVEDGDVQASIPEGTLDITWKGNKRTGKKGKLDLNASNGAIVVHVPSDFPMELEVEQISSPSTDSTPQASAITTTGVTPNASQSNTVSNKGKINSEFDLGVLPAGQQFEHQGKQHQLRQIKKTFAAGGQQVQIRTVNSDVSVLKIK